MRKVRTSGLDKPSNVLCNEEFRKISPYIPTDTLMETTSFRYWHEYYMNDECMGAVYQEMMEWLKNNNQRRIFFEWWQGGRLWKWNEFVFEHERADQYVKYSKEDWDTAGSAILSACSMGCG